MCACVQILVVNMKSAALRLQVLVRLQLVPTPAWCLPQQCAMGMTVTSASERDITSVRELFSSCSGRTESVKKKKRTSAFPQSPKQGCHLGLF